MVEAEGSPTELDRLRYGLRQGGASRPYLGSTSSGGVAVADAEHALLILGPPRSGKTTALVIPNVLAAPGPVITTSTKLDVLAATAGRRPPRRTWLLDPTGTVRPPEGVTAVRWSPVCAAAAWDDSLAVTRAMVGAARPQGRHGEAAHWTERAEALLAPLLHAAACSRADMRAVQAWVLRQDLDPARAVLGAQGARVAVDVLTGLAATDSREQSGIWSTAAGVLAAYRSDAALASSIEPNFDPATLTGTADTVYVCVPARFQELVAPIVVAFLEQARASFAAAHDEGRLALPLTLVLDELANIAPIPDLDVLVSEGVGHGVTTIAALQDLSQARRRWGPTADGFVSLFAAKVVLPGIGDLATLELVSKLVGETDVVTESVTRTPWWSPGRDSPSVTRAIRRQRRLPVDAVHQQPAGSAIVLDGSRPPEQVRLPPWWASPVFARERPTPERSRGAPGLSFGCGPPATG